MIDDILKDTLAPALKRLAFKRRGLCWNRRRGAFVDVISIQKARFSTQEEEHIKGYVAVCVPEFREIIFGPSPPFFTEADGIFSFRFTELEMNDLSGRVLDTWWKIRKENSKSIACDLQRLIAHKAVPFFDSCSSFIEAERLVCCKEGGLSKTPYFQLNKALLYWKLGEDEKCNEIISSIDKWPEKVELIRGVLGRV
jgi:hypothetical protein